MTIPHGKIRVLLLAGILAAFQRGAIVWAFGPANHRLFFSERRERTMTEISERILSERAGEPADPDSFDEVSVTPEMAGVANRAVSGPVFVRVRGNEVRWMWHVTARDYVQYVYDPEPAKEGGAGVPVGTGGRWRRDLY